MTRQNRKSEVRNDNILSFVQSSGPAADATALGLVDQAAEVFGIIEDRARETEARAQALCEAAVKRLQQAETRI